MMLINKYQKGGFLPIGNQQQYNNVVSIYQSLVSKGIPPQAALEIVNQKVAEKGWTGFATGDNKKYSTANGFADHIIDWHGRMYPDSLKARSFEDYWKGIQITPKYKYNSEDPNYKQKLLKTRPGVKKRINHYRQQQGLPLLTYINNICNDLKNPELNKFNHYEILDRQITVDECFLRLLRNFGYNDCVPDDDGIELLYKTVANLSQPELNVIYYKNNLYEFINNSKVKNIIITALVKLKDPFLSPTEVPEEIEDELKVLKDLMFEFIYYRHIWIDKLDRVYTMPRDVVLLTDTDSCIVSLDEWYRTILEWTIGVPMEIKYTREEIEKEMDKIILHKRKTEPIKEYDFYNQELVDAKRLKYPAVIIEEDNLRYSIVNILSYILSDIILDYMYLFGENYNAQTDNRECLLIMKNEFLFKSMFITNGKKNYADLQVLQEGNIIPEDKQLDVKGMPISKVGIPESRLMDILEYDILRESFVDQVDLIRKFVVLEKDIIKSLKAKSKEYHKPARLAPMASYKAPMSQQGIKASYAYNAIKSNEEEGIDLEDRNTVLIIKTKINTKNYNIIENEFPEHTLRLAKLLNTPEYKGNITSIAIPTNIDIPSWIIPFIDYNTIVQDNLRSFPLKELGISKLESKNVTHSNIVSF